MWIEINVNKIEYLGYTGLNRCVAAALNSADHIPVTASSLGQRCSRAVGGRGRGRDRGGGKDDKLPEMPLKTFFCLSG